MRTAATGSRRLTRVEYERLVETGVLDEDDRVELLGGLLVVREPQGSRHASLVAKIHAVLERAFGRGYHVRDHSPVALSDVSEPEPDLAVVRGQAMDYRDAHPSAPVLVVEVADSSLDKDRRRKAALCARAGLADYWVVNLVADTVEVHRQPGRLPSGRVAYRQVRVLRRGATISPLGAPRARISVGALLP